MLMTSRPFYSSALLAAALLPMGVPLSAQLPGNATLQGTYYFRYLGVNSSPANKARSALGTLSFDGNGKVQVTGQQINNTSPGSDQPINVSTTVTYSVFSSGMSKRRQMIRNIARMKSGVCCIGCWAWTWKTLSSEPITFIIPSS